MNTIVITGATSGIGFATAKLLASKGFRIIGVGRDALKCRRAELEVNGTAPNSGSVYFTADLMQQREVNALADRITAFINENCGGRLYALINNAGCARSRYMTTEEGYEQQFALNYLAGFLLTFRLLPMIEKAGGKVLVTSSKSHNGIKVHWNDVMLTGGYNPLTAYKQSKLCCLLFAKGLNDKFGQMGIRAYAVDPGLVRTDIGNKGTGGIVNMVWSLRKLSGKDPSVPAKTYAYLCDEKNEAGGLYYYLCQERRYSGEVTSENAVRLFELSEKLCGVKYGEVQR